jgi:RimJ/RimL family protein N-acetyltransferase
VSNTLFFLNGSDHEAMVRWACSQIPWMTYSEAMKAVAIGAPREDGSVDHLGVCLFHGFIEQTRIDFGDGRGERPAYGLCEISFAAKSPRWASRRTISSLLHIPFMQYNCRKVVTVIPSTNKRAIRFNEGIGLKPEGTLRHHFAKGVHACIHGMMRSEWEARWKHPQPARRPTGLQAHGLQERISASSA